MWPWRVNGQMQFHSGSTIPASFTLDYSGTGSESGGQGAIVLDVDSADHLVNVALTLTDSSGNSATDTTTVPINLTGSTETVAIPLSYFVGKGLNLSNIVHDTFVFGPMADLDLTLSGIGASGSGAIDVGPLGRRGRRVARAIPGNVNDRLLFDL